MFSLMESKKQFPRSPPYPFVITDYPPPPPPPPPPYPTSPHMTPPSPPVTSTPPSTNIGLISGVSATGVVVLIIMSVIDLSLPSDTFNLKDWEINYIQKGQSDQIIDSHLIIGDINPDSLKRFMEIAERCVVDHGADRPSMGDFFGIWSVAFNFKKRLFMVCPLKIILTV
ncbi:hypothetical protein KIW84_022158 [Lathyrus oleraceus]|uniref:Uncharacterized protein n=1 Tax=Pisum sativum TaxID=3888 RepID=A0A9D5B9L1_PEA|nr:hypothetical protein KIW84_022158 [Pisum sativum]